MTEYELFAVQRDTNKLRSLYMELADHENFNPYKENVMTDMPKGKQGFNFVEWHYEEKERIEKEIEFYKQKLQIDRKKIADFVKTVSYPECEIIQYRVVNNLGWFEIGELLCMDRRTASRKFFNYLSE